jgi:hypothetical protein
MSARKFSSLAGAIAVTALLIARGDYSIHVARTTHPWRQRIAASMLRYDNLNPPAAVIQAAHNGQRSGQNLPHAT